MSPIDPLLSVYRKKNLFLYTQFDLTYRCNFRCLHCYVMREKREDHRNEELSLEEINRILLSLKELRVLCICFSGGEIFLREDIFDILSSAKSAGFIIDLKTNGSLIGERELDILQKIKPRKIDVSFFSLQEDIHEEFTRTSNTMNRVITSILEMKKRNLNVEVALVITTKNYDVYPKVVQFFMDKGITVNYNYKILGDNPSFTSGWHLNYWLGKNRDKLVLYLLWHKRTYPASDMNSPEYEVKPDDFLCEAGNTYFMINPYGEVKPCVVLREHYGNIREQDIRAIVYQDRFRSAGKKNRNEIQWCRRCKLKNFCNYCIAWNDRSTGDKYKRSKWQCQFESTFYRMKMSSHDPIR